MFSKIIYLQYSSANMVNITNRIKCSGLLALYIYLCKKSLRKHE